MSNGRDHPPDSASPLTYRTPTGAVEWRVHDLLPSEFAILDAEVALVDRLLGGELNELFEEE